MRETTIALMAERTDLRSVPDLLGARAAINPDHVAFARWIDGEVHDVTIAQFREQVHDLAGGLIAAGVKPGDRVAIMSETCYEWALADFAIWAAGGVVVPIYDTASIPQVERIVSECGVRVAFASDGSHRDVLAHALPGIAVWTFDANPGHDLAALERLGSGVDEVEIERREQLAGPDDLASIVFTSGTTGRQKGVRITHGNFVRLVVQVTQAYGEVVHDRATTIILLPLAHVLAQGLQLVSVYAGMKIVHVGDPKSAVAAMGEVRPTFMVVVPRILEKIRVAARAKAQESKVGSVFAVADRTAIAWGEHLERTQDQPDLRPSRWLVLRHRLFERLFYGRLRALMGGRLDYLLSGASALDPSVGNFFRGVGIPVIEGYGLTETTAPITGNRPGTMRAGSVGIPIPGSSVRISDEGEVLVRGVGVSPGYLNPKDDGESYTDGFYRTGDVGRLDQDGFLYIQGRLKNIIVTASGKNIAPEPWEAVVATDPIVSEAIMVGEGKPYAAAVILLDAEQAAAWARRRGSAELAQQLEAAPTTRDGIRIDDEGIRAHIQRTVDGANAAVSRAEQVRRFIVLMAVPSEDDRTLTPTLKLRRTEFLNTVAHHVHQLYQGENQS